MKKIHEYQQELLISVMSQELPAFIRKGNYRDLSGSSAITLLPELYRAVLTRLQEAGALFSKDSCAFPYWVDEEIRQVFVAVQGLSGYDRKEFRNLLHEIETGLLEERVKTNTSSAVVRPATTDYPDVRQWYTRRSGEGIQLLIPEIKTVVGRLRPGEKMVIGGYAGSYKTVLLEHIVAEAIKESLMPVLFISSSRSRHEVRSRILDRMREKTLVPKLRRIRYGKWKVVLRSWEKSSLNKTGHLASCIRLSVKRFKQQMAQFLSPSTASMNLPSSPTRGE
jgi:hypothetical protein